MPSAQAQRLQRLIAVLARARNYLSFLHNDFSWSSWQGANVALQEIDGIIEQLRKGSLPDPLTMRTLFAPTGPIQEVSLSSGWGPEFCSLASEFDAALAGLTQTFT
jgi:hypothetical protein